MKQFFLLSLSMLFSLSIFAQLSEKNPDSHQNYPGPKSANVLYDQTAGSTTTGLFSMEIPSSGNCKTGVADDFIVVGNDWEITSVDVLGFAQAGSPEPPSFTVRILSDNGGIPFNELAIRSEESYSLNAGVYTIDLSTPIQLAPGTYWLQVLAHDDYPPNRWNWISTGATGYNGPAYIEDPCVVFGGFNWTTVESLVAGHRDFAFVVYGNVIPTVPLNSWPIVIVIALLMLIVGVTTYRKRSLMA